MKHLFNGLNGIWRTIERSQERRANHWILHNMTDRQLKDMGINRGDLYRKLYK